MTLRAILWLAVSTTAQAEDDKTSLPEQEKAARALAEREGWRVVDTLRVPGHSRAYIDIHKLAADMEREGIDAFTRLLKHFEVGDFDVLVCRDSERFARTQSLHAYVVESVIGAGARIYSLADGWVDETNFRMFISMAGYKAASDIDRLVKGRHKAMDARAARGLPTSSGVIESHKIIRDDLGRAVIVVPDEDKRKLFEDAAALFIEGVGWKDLEVELFRRFGYVRDDGKPYARTAFYQWFQHPTFWGHSARYFRDDTKPNGTKLDLWVFDESEPLPDGVEVYRNTHAPMFTGELAERLKAELRRRRWSIRGTARPRRSKRFSGLCVCAECHYYLVYVANKANAKFHAYQSYPGYKCTSTKWESDFRPACSNRRYIPEPRLQDFFTSALQDMLDTLNPNAFIQPDGSDAALARQIAASEKDIDNLNKQIRRLVQKQAATSDDLANIYDDEIRRVNDQLKRRRADLASLQRERARIDTRDARDAFEDLKAHGVQWLWQQPDTFINQLLHRLMGKRRLVIREGEVVGTTDAPPAKRYHR